MPAVYARPTVSVRWAAAASGRAIAHSQRHQGSSDESLKMRCVAVCSRAWMSTEWLKCSASGWGLAVAHICDGRRPRFTEHSYVLADIRADSCGTSCASRQEALQFAHGLGCRRNGSNAQQAGGRSVYGTYAMGAGHDSPSIRTLTPLTVNVNTCSRENGARFLIFDVGRLRAHTEHAEPRMAWQASMEGGTDSDSLSPDNMLNKWCGVVRYRPRASYSQYYYLTAIVARPVRDMGSCLPSGGGVGLRCQRTDANARASGVRSSHGIGAMGCGCKRTCDCAFPATPRQLG